MKRIMLKRLIATTMVCMFIINGITVNKVVATTNDQNEIAINLSKLNPVPQNMEVMDSVLTLTPSVNIQGLDVADEDAVRILNEFLANNNITVNETFDEGSTTLIIGELDDDIKELDDAKERIGVANTAELREEGYVLAVDSTDGNNGTILIEGKDGNGTFYGVKTLSQLAVNNGESVAANDVVISDEPTMGTRGIVEGFYGTPWTHQDRLDQIEFYGDHKMNTYIYAPKDDPYHRDRWREPYPESEMARMNELIQTAADNKVDFVFALSPGIDIKFDGDAGEADFQALMAKCESLYAMGVRSFSILYDDIHNKEGVKQAQLLNRFNNEFVKVKGDVKPLITVPTEYDTFAMNNGGSVSQYTSDFASTLDEDIMVMWTGSVVVPEDLTLENAQFVKSVYGDRMGIWWNYPVSDYMREKLALGPIYQVDNALAGQIDFFTMNPMEHAHMSKVTLATGADYSWNTSEYDQNQSWRRAIEMEYGNLAPAMFTLANHSTRLSSTGRQDAPEVRATMEQLISKLAKGEDATSEINVLTTEFNNMVTAVDTLRAGLAADVFAECSSNLNKLKLLGENSKHALDLLVAESEGDSAEALRLKTLIDGNMSSLNSGSKVSEKVALAFIKEAVTVGLNPKANFVVSDTFVAPGEEVIFTNTSSLSAANLEWRFEGANIETSTETNPTVVYDEEGRYSVTLVAKNILGEDEIVKESIVTVSSNSNMERSNLALNKSVSASSYVNAAEAPQKAVDGNGGTKWCANRGSTHNLTIDLGKVSTITNVVIKHAGAGGEGISGNTRDYRIQVSEDGTNYVEVANIKGNESDITNDRISVTNARYVKLLVDKPTQTTDSATRIFEVEVMGVDEAVKLPPEYINPNDARKSMIYPVPQEANFLSGDGMELQGDVNVVIHGEQEAATTAKLESILEENNISYAITEAVVEDKANIVITSSKDHCDDCVDSELISNAALTKKEGYVLKATDDVNEKGNISIVGADKDGAYYGVLTLGQLLEKKENDKIVEAVIADYPEIEFRGFIEGFYGTPWSHEDRISLMKDTSDYKMNTYIYAPKDDPYHRANWKELYPEAEAKQIQELAEAGTENNVNFCWTIHPGASLQFTEADFNALIAKYEQLYDLGVRQFGVLFDDTDDWSRGRQQAEWINRIDQEFVKVKGDVAPMIVISARYNSAWGPSMNNYFKPFMQTLNKDIQVMWTGHATMSNISKDVMEWPKTQTGVDKDLAVWWNYPVNDYCDSRLLMAPLHNLSTDLDNASGFFSNPMNQAEASKVALYSIADYTWNTDEFNYMKSWETSIEKLVPEVKEEYMRFASNTAYLKDTGGASGPFEYDESWYLTENINKLNDKIAKGESVVEAANDLLTEFNTIVSDCTVIREKINNENLLTEIDVFLGAYEALGEAGKAAMEALIAAEEGNVEAWLDNNNLAKEKLALMGTFVVDRVEASGPVQYAVAVGEKRLQPLVRGALTASSNVISKAIFKNADPAVITTEEVEATVSFENGVYSLSEITGLELSQNDYIGMILSKATKSGEIEVEANDYEGLVLEYSLNGIEWTVAETEIIDGVMKIATPLDITFVRVVNTAEASKTVDITSFVVKPVYRANPSISQNIGQYQSNSIDKALDGNMSTKYWSDKPTGAGHYIQLDLGNKIPLYDVAAYFGSTDYMRNSEYLISEDGVNWTSLGTLQYTNEGDKKVARVNANGQMAKYVRIKSNGDNSGFWVQLFEVEFNKTVPDFGSDYVELVSGTPAGRWDALYDMDLSTAFEAETINDGDALTYKMTRVTNVGDLVFLQDSNNICEATVSVKKTDGTWREVGKLGKQLTTLAINENVLEVKLDFDASKPTPKIYEIIVNENTVIEEAYKDHLEIAVEVARTITDEDLKNVVPVVVNEFKAALQEAEEILANPRATQVEVDASWDRLSDALHKLSFYKGDKTHLIALVDRINKLNGDEFIAKTWDKLQVVLAEVNVVINDENALEKEVAESYNELMRAYLELRLKPNKDKLQDLINKADQLDSSKYTKDSFKAVEKALVRARTVFNDENAEGKDVEKAQKDLELALNSLVEKDEDNSNNGNNGGDNGNNGGNSGSGNTTGGSNSGSGKLPNTGGVPAATVGFFGAIVSMVGAVIARKKK